MNFHSAGGLNENHRLRRGFSFIELLAVCAVAMLVLALAPPSLQFTASQSRHALCLQRLHAIGQASLTYSSTDAAESSIPVHRQQFTQNPNSPTMIGAYEWGGKSGIGQPGFVGYPGILGSRYGTLAGFGPATRPLNSILYPHGFRNNLVPSVNRPGAT
ncbi:MAG: prepilin-type N-terminal cleavage/methylation domain-containing protein, partial [Phycisphaerales bacterium]|nr:prepilin-type N-terminal cleavage/methylation domain-containing protein [Phycisphaerales bacterium]